MNVLRCTCPLRSPLANRSEYRKVARFLVGIGVRGLLLVCGVTLFIAVLASPGQALVIG
jgi:hypothetical protein